MHNTKRLLTVDPMTINIECHRDRLDENKRADFGTVQGGDWDLQFAPFHTMDVWEAFEQRFVKGVAWQETNFYKRVVNTIASGTDQWGCYTQADYDARCVGLDALYEKIRDEGYRPQSELEGKEDSYDDISVSIDRNGRWFFEDGRHRLCIAKLLKLESVPVQVSVRHSIWFDFCQKVDEFTTRFRDSVYEPIPHPDLDYHYSVYGNERFEMIREAVSDYSGKMLEIGSHWGYFCHRFESLGMNCTAIENDPDQLYYLKKLHTAAEAQFEIHTGSILDLEPNQYDVTLALDAFHYFLKHPDTFAQLERFLRTLKTKCMVFQPHFHGCREMEGAYRNFHPQEFVDWVLKSSDLNQVKLLGKTRDGRSIYLLT